MIPLDVPAIHAPAFETAVFLHALAEVESGNDPKKIGRRGERTRWQISEAVWQDYMFGRSFAKYCAVDRLAADCANRHLAWLVRELTHRNIAITPEHLATCWRWGLTGGIDKILRYRKIPESAVRVGNLYREEIANE